MVPDMIDFQNPLMLLFLPAIALLAIGYVIQQTRRRRYAVRCSSLALLNPLVCAPWHRRVPELVFLAGLAVLVLASARPVLRSRSQPLGDSCRSPNLVQPRRDCNAGRLELLP